MFGLRRTMTRVSTLAPNFSISETYRKSTGHKVRDFISKIGGFFEPLKKYIFPNFIAVHYFYIITMTIITSILLYPVHNAKYIDILFLATGAATQGGLNTIDVNGLTLYQQIIIYITCCLTTPIAIHGFLAFVRLYWFERYFDGIRDFSKKDFKMRRTKTILQREMTRRSFQNHRQRTMSFASGDLHSYHNRRESPYGEELQLKPTLTMEIPNKSKSESMNPISSENITAVGTSAQLTRESSVESSQESTRTTSDSTKIINTRESTFSGTPERREENSHSTDNSNVDLTQQTSVRREGSSSKNFQEKLFSGQLVNRDEEPIPEESSSSLSRASSISRAISERGNTSQRNSLDVRSNESRKPGSNSNSRLRLNEMLEKAGINRSTSNTNINAEEQRFAKRRNSTEITPQDMLKSIQMLRDQHNDAEDDDDDGPALVIEAPHISKEPKGDIKGMTKAKLNINEIDSTRLSVNPSSKRTVSNLSKRSNTSHDRLPSVTNNSPPAPVLAVDEESDSPLEMVAQPRSNIASDINDSISSGNAADINDDNSSDEDNDSGNVDDSFAISMNSETESSFNSADSTDRSVRSLSLPRSNDNSMSIASPSIGENSHFSRLKSNSTTELVTQNHQDLDERIMIHPLPDKDEQQPRVKFGPEPDHKPTIHFDIEPPKRNLMKIESAYDQVDSTPQRPIHRRSPSTSGYLKKQIQKGRKFRKNLRRRLSTGSIEKEDKLTDNDSPHEEGPSPIRSRRRYNHEYETHPVDQESDEGKEMQNIHSSPGHSVHNIIARTVTFDATDKSKLNELAKEPDFQRAVYKQWKKEHRKKRRMKGSKRINTRYGPRRWTNNQSSSIPVPQPRTQTARGVLENTHSDQDSVETFNSAYSSPGSLQNKVTRTNSSSVPYALYETPSKGSNYHSGLSRPNSRFANDDNNHDDDGYENEGDDNDYEDDEETDENDDEEDPGYYGFHVDNDVALNFPDQIHPLSKTMSSNYLSWKPKVARNSNFIGLSKVQKDELGGVEYRAIKLLCRILVVYYVGFHVMAFVMLLPWICRDSKYAHIVRGDGVSPAWWGFFTAMSAFNDLGLTLTPDSMSSFNTAVYPLVVMIWFIIIGNTGFPIFLRFIIWVMFKISPELSHMKESLGFLLDHPRRCFTMLFPESATWWLVLTLLGLNLTDFILFIILDLGSTVLKPIKRGYRVLNGLFQAVSTRTAGFGVVDLGGLNAATQVSYMLMMYVSVLPLAISIRRTNVYEEQSLGMYSEMDESESEAETEAETDEDNDTDELTDADEVGSELSGSVHEGSTKSHKSGTSSSHSHKSDKKHKKSKKKRKKKKKKKNPEDSTRSFIGQHLRKQLSFDLWFVFLGLFIICICENNKIKDSTMPEFNIFSILFEVISAYGTVGLSLGYPGTNQSFSGRFTTLSKLVIIGMLIRGRNRGLPYSVDRAIILPSERLEHIDHLEDLKLKRRRFKDEASDPLTGFVRGNMRRFTHKVEKTPLYKSFTQDFRGSPNERGRQHTFPIRRHGHDHPHFSHEYFDEEEAPISAYQGSESDNDTFISRHRPVGTSSQHQQMWNDTIA